ncbi:MAG: hypothetical protein AAF802_07700 [Planctomycetota bacterium]
MKNPTAMSFTEPLFRLPSISLALGGSLLRIDAAPETPSQPDSDGFGDATIEERTENLLFDSHTDNLIRQLSDWSLQLDRRESELARREDSLRRNERRSRQQPTAHKKSVDLA